MVFEANGQTYAVNGNAHSRIKDGKYRDIFEIVAADSATMKLLQEANCPVKRIPKDIVPILDLGVAMMDEK